MFWEALWALVVGFWLSGMTQAFVSRRQMRRLLGGSGVLPLLRATGFGAASSSCSYAAAAMTKSLFTEGAGFVTAMAFMLASTNLVIELGIVVAVLIGWQFAAAELVGGLVMIALFAAVAHFALPRSLIDAARSRLEAAKGPDAHGAEAAKESSWSVKLRSPQLWGTAARYCLADLRMLRKELLGGFLAAGFLAALVPDQVWRAVFVSGHGLPSAIENAAIGPLIAMASFVCSVGNVPLAAALWKGGISFGGVASFIYADLITFPLLLIYRKYYGGRLTLRLLGSFWLVMASAGLVTQYLFQALDAIPRTRPHQIASHALAWNFTTLLDLTALLALAAIVFLALRFGRSGTEDRHAIDPVCGMQVERALAPARLVHQGQEFHFCSDQCRDRFLAHPERHRALGSQPTSPANCPPQADPVCGMMVDPADPGAKLEYPGGTVYFCCQSCADRYLSAGDSALRGGGAGD
ncbi:MAG: permease [Candidatus Dormibacteria bacterium]